MTDTVTRPCSRCFVCWILCLIVIHVADGCSADRPTSRKAEETQDIAHLRVQLDRQPDGRIPGPSSSEQNGLTDPKIEEIRTAIERRGGTLRCDEQGRLIKVDLLTGRASADAAALDVLKACPDVKVLHARLGQVNASQFSTIASLTGLEDLMLQDAAIDDNTLIDLGVNLPHLRRLTVRNAPEITDRAITELARHSALTHLALIDMQVTGQSLRQIASMPSLIFLDLRMCHGIQGAELAALSAAPKLKELKLGGSGIDNATLAVVATLPHLESLTIEDAAIDGDGISHLAGIEATAKRLESLAFARCSTLTDDQLHSLAAFRNLRQLTLRDVPITGLFLHSLHSTDELERLSLNQTFLVEEAFERIATCRNLKRLELSQNILTHQSMEYIGTLPKLEYLNLTDCAISDALLEPLTDLPTLQTIIVAGNPDVSREAVADLLGQHTRTNE